VNLSVRFQKIKINKILEKIMLRELLASFYLLGD